MGSGVGSCVGKGFESLEDEPVEKDKAVNERGGSNCSVVVDGVTFEGAGSESPLPSDTPFLDVGASKVPAPLSLQTSPSLSRGFVVPPGVMSSIVGLSSPLGGLWTVAILLLT